MMGERAYSNWELSADRANASRQELIAGGMQEGKVLRVLGLADTMPLEKKDVLAPVNRRISIVVLNKRAQAQFESENASAAEVSVQAQKGRAAEELQAQVEQAQAASAPAARPSGSGAAGKGKIE
jgi:chemotaxis protein MotB